MEEKRSFRSRLVPGFLREYVQIWKDRGFKALLKEKGWKVVVIIFFYYLIRDSFLYLLLPYLIAKGIFSNF